MSPDGAQPDGLIDLSPAVAAACAGDDAAFSALYTAVQPGLLRYLRVLVGQDAEDVASEAWLQIVRDLRSYRGEGAGFRAWAASIARHRAMDHLRRQSRRPAQHIPVEQLEHVADAQDTAIRAVEMVSTEAALALIATLPRDQAEAVLLRVVVGLDAQAAAQVLGKRAGAVRTSAYRGLRRLAGRLDETPTTQPPVSQTAADTPAPRSGTVRWVTNSAAVAPKDMR
ncbi:MAG TPA: RNA polymerase sigma factor [Pseudonocardiaceae bacterium]